MKKFFYLVMLGLVLFSTFACTSIATTPFVYTNSGNTDIKILGEVVYESSDRIGYTELLKAARNIYPDCDYVIDIMIDRRDTTTVLFFFLLSTKTTWTMRGTAVKYASLTSSEGYR
ncbi:MAG: hypothetical protein LBI04_05960 [Treponema sp.]|jgi:hypothetical protein|nr:hypothetical protein [Treponema sp.]